MTQSIKRRACSDAKGWRVIDGSVLKAVDTKSMDVKCRFCPKFASGTFTITHDMIGYKYLLCDWLNWDMLETHFYRIMKADTFLFRSWRF